VLVVAALAEAVLVQYPALQLLLVKELRVKAMLEVLVLTLQVWLVAAEAVREMLDSLLLQVILAMVVWAWHLPLAVY
jgi:hypothetical protein